MTRHSWWQRGANNQKVVLVAVLILWVSLQTVYFYQQIQARQAANTLENLQPYVQRLARLQASQPTPTSAAIPLTTLIKKSSQRHRVKLVGLTPQDGDMAVALAPMPFNQFIAWLAELQREHGIQVRSLHITAQPSSEQIHIDTLRLQRLLAP